MAQPGVLPAPPTGVRERLLNYLLDNPLKSLSMGTLVVGGLLLLMYFIRIGFMPDVNIESVTSLLYAVALLGLFIGAFTAVMLVMPGMLLRMARSFCKAAVGVHLLAVSVAFGLLWAIALLNLFGLLSGLWAWIWATVVWLVLPAVGVWRSPLSTGTRGAVWVWSLLVIALLALLFFVPVSFVFLIGLSGDINHAPTGQAVLLLISLVICVATSAWVLGTAQDKQMVGVVAYLGPTLLFLVLSITGNFTVFSKMAVTLLGAGEINAARVVVTGKGCQEVNEALGQRVCKDVGDEKATAICPVTIRSRIGSQVVLEFAPLAAVPPASGAASGTAPSVMWATAVKEPGKSSDKGLSLVRRVIMDKSKLLSWRPLTGWPEHDLPAPPKAGERVASWLSLTSGPGGDRSPDVNGQASAEVGRALAQRCGRDDGALAPAPAPSAASAASAPAPAASAASQPLVPKKPRARPSRPCACGCTVCQAWCPVPVAQEGVASGVSRCPDALNVR